MTDFFDTGTTITSLGIGEALVTVLSPRGVPTPLAPTRLVPPDSLMGALPPDELERRISTGQLYAKYAETVDPQSAHEIITARLEAARTAVAGMAAVPGTAAGGDAATMTPAQERKAIEDRARELERVRREAERDATAQAKVEAAAARAAERARLQREREITQVGTTVLRGVLGTLFGGPRRRR
jgi:hypothetical protein